MSQVGIVIVNWNTGDLLRKCLLSIDSLDERNMIYHVIVIDNNSHDDSIRLAENITYTIPVTFIRNSENKGFARANNIGIKQLREGKNDIHILLLNPDTQMKNSSLKNLVNEIESYPNRAIAGPKLLNSDGSIQPSVRKLPTIGVFVFLFLKLHYLFPHSRMWNTYIMKGFNYDNESYVDQVMGAAFLIRNSTFDTIGLLDERYWIWFEEVDYCTRVLTKGLYIIYTPRSTVIHHGAASFHQLIGIQRTIPFLNSSLVYARKHLTRPSLFVLKLLYPIALLLSLPSSLIHKIRNKKLLRATYDQ